MRKITKTILKSVLSVCLAGSTGFVITQTATPSTVAQAATVSKDTFNHDLDVMIQASNTVGGFVSDNFGSDQIQNCKADPLDAYSSHEDGFPGIVNDIGSVLNYTNPVEYSDNRNAALANTKENVNVLMSIYNDFSGRFSSSDRATLSNDISKLNSSSYTTKNVFDKANAAEDFADDLSDAMANYGNTLTKVTSSSTSTPSNSPKKSGTTIPVVPANGANSNSKSSKTTKKVTKKKTSHKKSNKSNKKKTSHKKTNKKTNKKKTSHKKTSHKKTNKKKSSRKKVSHKKSYFEWIKAKRKSNGDVVITGKAKLYQKADMIEIYMHNNNNDYWDNPINKKKGTFKAVVPYTRKTEGIQMVLRYGGKDGLDKVIIPTKIVHVH
ncbi:hypothetical protein IWT140_00087 [Secundilactobacillus pentosiphilus]|uniref:Uncharacterized protein n=1 Tax=Secundilactobacillus pentosiphilus TaxID=1714682 RepID=A0A1Z5IL47_9LACO|nr:hypothetical protein [Secundilactobacillus pentosiphilus]GAX02490.1 hypothetical protein IWT140_00087 [Secundilactobacillus pentosiphilus]